MPPITIINSVACSVGMDPNEVARMHIKVYGTTQGCWSYPTWNHQE